MSRADNQGGVDMRRCPEGHESGDHEGFCGKFGAGLRGIEPEADEPQVDTDEDARSTAVAAGNTAVADSGTDNVQIPAVARRPDAGGCPMPTSTKPFCSLEWAILERSALGAQFNVRLVEAQAEHDGSKPFRNRIYAKIRAEYVRDRAAGRSPNENIPTFDDPDLRALVTVLAPYTADEQEILDTADTACTLFNSLELLHTHRCWPSSDRLTGARCG